MASIVNCKCGVKVLGVLGDLCSICFARSQPKEVLSMSEELPEEVLEMTQDDDSNSELEEEQDQFEQEQEQLEEEQFTPPEEYPEDAPLENEEDQYEEESYSEEEDSEPTNYHHDDGLED